MRRRIAVIVLLISSALLLAACGGGGSDASMDMSAGGNDSMNSMDKNRPVVAGAREIAISADNFSFDPKQLTIGAGEDVTIVLSPVDKRHDFYVKGVGHVVDAAAGTTEKGGLKIEKAGTYRFWCTILGHKGQGMTGTITVTD
jgi:plastocyanin